MDTPSDLCSITSIQLVIKTPALPSFPSLPQLPASPISRSVPCVIPYSKWKC